MGLFSKLARSNDLVNGMAVRLGADMTDILGQDPEAQAPKLRSMVMRCTGCAQIDACAQLQDACDSLQAAPEYCLNKPVMDAARRARS